VDNAEKGYPLNINPLFGIPKTLSDLLLSLPQTKFQSGKKYFPQPKLGNPPSVWNHKQDPVRVKFIFKPRPQPIIFQKRIVRLLQKPRDQVSMSNTKVR